MENNPYHVGHVSITYASQLSIHLVLQIVSDKSITSSNTESKLYFHKDILWKIEQWSFESRNQLR